jgi:NAD(P)-dependent dehydrogenase (short-subunit alcohol dehydrogenase family)
MNVAFFFSRIAERKSILIKGDVGKPEEVKRMFAKVKGDFDGSLDIFVHSARPNPGAWPAPPMEATPEGLGQAAKSKIRLECHGQNLSPTCTGRSSDVTPGSAGRASRPSASARWSSGDSRSPSARMPLLRCVAHKPEWLGAAIATGQPRLRILNFHAVVNEATLARQMKEVGPPFVVTRLDLKPMEACSCHRMISKEF